MSLPQASSPAPIWSRRARLAREAATASTPKTAATIPSVTAPQPTILREICLGYTCYENKRAHWYIYIPSTTDLGLGKVIQVTGNSWIGFGFQVKTNFSIRTKRSENEHCIRLGYVTPDLVVDDYTPDAECAADIRSHPVDKIEEVAYNLGLPIQKPDATLPPPDDPIWNSPHADFERCQDWIRKLVRALVDEYHYMPADALTALDSATSFGL